MTDATKFVSVPTTDGKLYHMLSTSTRLNGTNYPQWSRSFRLLLLSLRKLKHIEEDPPNKEDKKAYEAWEIDDGMVISVLNNSCDQNIFNNVIFLETTKDMWDTLKRIYSAEHNISHIYNIYSRLFSLKQDGRPISEYFAEVQGLWSELKLYQPNVVDIAKLEKQKEEFIVAKILSGMDDNLGHVKDNLLADTEVPSLVGAYSRVLRASTKLNLSGATSVETMESGSNSALAVGVFGRGRGRGRGRGSPCVHCQKIGHQSDFCWKKYGRGGSRLKPVANLGVSGESQTLVPEQLVQQPPSDPPFDKGVTLSRDEYEAFQRLLKGSAGSTSSFHATTSGSVSAVNHGSSWIVDSGASCHMTGPSDEEADWWRS